MVSKTKRSIIWLASDEKLEELPIDPHIFYSEEWEGWDIYLGLQPSVREMLNSTPQNQTNGFEFLENEILENEILLEENDFIEEESVTE